MPLLLQCTRGGLSFQSMFLAIMITLFYTVLLIPSSAGFPMCLSLYCLESYIFWSLVFLYRVH